MLSHASSFDGSRGSTMSSVEGVGFGELGESGQYFSLVLIHSVFYPSENGDFNTFPERK